MSDAEGFTFSERDRLFMDLALRRAAEALERGDPPIGAVLAINGDYLDSDSNSNTSDRSWSCHAEHKLITRHAVDLRRRVEVQGANVELFSTLEPCLMCIGVAVFARVRRLVFSLRDATAGATELDPCNLGEWYGRNWPRIQGGLLRENSEALIARYRPVYPFPGEE